MREPLPAYEDGGFPVSWQELSQGAPTLVALAQLCSRALAAPPREPPPLSVEARAILHLARERGIIEIKGTFRAFDAAERLLAVHVETAPERLSAFRPRGEPRITIRFLDAFRELCQAGLILHHLGSEFSLSRTGFDLAAQPVGEEVAAAAALAREV